MKLPETRVEVLSEKDKWENIINSSDWVVFRKYLESHCLFLQNQVNEDLRCQRFTDAYGTLRAMDDARKMLESVRIRLVNLNKLSEKGEK